ncbi:hypothetical protein [Xenorhabdus eapokensis]|uniref:Autoinducer 2 ABC transporter ATP-binding protein LsrA n=1 Tax=Xenorhabdus eapokensis TaxID=1873482 RepID=A0A1Q5TR91_9GAMM|nr:hypothetical protein [Xenorhabdus eapokensis]OKP02737.1 autoinducer 2 ABC transporter ATP-binding protein LsrA [Xenorhabdus eapokensis]
MSQSNTATNTNDPSCLNPTNNTPLLVARGISKQFSGLMGLKQIDFVLAPTKAHQDFTKDNINQYDF